MASAGAVAVAVAFACLMGVGAGATPSAPAFTGVWDAYPAAFIAVCPHLPRNPIAWDKLNGRWFVLEKGGLWPAETLCEVHFRVEGGGGGEGRNLTLRVSMAGASDDEAAQRRDATWTMSADNVWRDREMSLFVGLSGGARSLLLLCAVEAAGAAAGAGAEAAEAARDGYSLALARRPQDFRPGALARELKRARLSDQVLATDRAECIPAPDSAR